MPFIKTITLLSFTAFAMFACITLPACILNMGSGWLARVEGLDLEHTRRPGEREEAAAYDWGVNAVPKVGAKASDAVKEETRTTRPMPNILRPTISCR